VIILVSSLLAATAANAEIKVGFVSSLSGPAASIGVPYSKGIAAAFAYASEVNGEQIVDPRHDLKHGKLGYWRHERRG
jgi:branched-chain amino acid transport system substrate-binding protein